MQWGKKVAGTNEFAFFFFFFFAVEAYVPGGSRIRPKIPAGTGTKIYFSSSHHFCLSYSV